MCVLPPCLEGEVSPRVPVNFLVVIAGEVKRLFVFLDHVGYFLSELSVLVCLFFPLRYPCLFLSNLK